MSDNLNLASRRLNGGSGDLIEVALGDGEMFGRQRADTERAGPGVSFDRWSAA